MEWLKIIAWVSLLTAFLCSVWIAIDIASGRRQHMWIMNVVWPLSALWAGPFALYYYFKVGRLSTEEAVMGAKQRGEEPPGKQKPFRQTAGLAASHCGAGCTLGDIIVEWSLFFFPVTLFGEKIFGSWAVDYAVAFVIGIGFQYFTIQPMRNLPPGEALKQAVKADAFSITSWQVGMYGWMAIATFLIFGHELEKTSPVFWFMMQIAMFAGFFTSYPVNWWLVRSGRKERM